VNEKKKIEQEIIRQEKLAQGANKKQQQFQ